MTGGSHEQPRLLAQDGLYEAARKPVSVVHHHLPQPAQEPLSAITPTCNHTSSNTTHKQLSQDTSNAHNKQPPTTNGNQHDTQPKEEEEEEAEEDEEIELLSEALLGVASAEEYAAKIVRIQQACLTPLKEDLADWLNKIMNLSTISSTNFMHKLDNGVIICRLAKVISNWCKQQQLANALPQHHQLPASATGSQLQLNSSTLQPPMSATTIANGSTRPSCSPKLSTSSINVHSSLNGSSGELSDCKDYDCLNHYRNRKLVKSSVISTSPRQNRFGQLTSNKGAAKSSSQSTYCLMSSSQSIASQSDYFKRDQFLSNFKRIDQTKIWEEAKSRTFYARDNVCNFIKWSKDFGVNQSVLFESDDLVLHANTRQVVLCLLDVARIACVKHGFVEAPGLVKFEQEIGREKAAAAIDAIKGGQKGQNCDELVKSDAQDENNSSLALTSRRLSSLPRNTIGDATDDLIMRYCIHKEEEASRKRAAELESLRLGEQEEPEAVIPEPEIEAATLIERLADDEPELVNADDEAEQNNSERNNDRRASDDIDGPLRDSLERDEGNTSRESSSQKDTSSSTVESHVDSLDSGEGRTESASTSHSRTPVSANRNNNNKRHHVSSIPVPIKRSNSNMSLASNHTSSIAASEMSSSRSSLLSGQDATSSQGGTTSGSNNNTNGKHHIASDLDGKVMHIAKSYYGKAATKGITRLSEGKYKIADRIVFVRLLKGHRVMVRIGGGWDTLENFLFRHKSDPSQVIDVDNLLPLESKMTPDKGSQLLLTPTHNRSTSTSKLPYYKRSSSVSSTNLSTCNLFFPDLSR